MSLYDEFLEEEYNQDMIFLYQKEHELWQQYEQWLSKQEGEIIYEQQEEVERLPF